MIRYGIAILGLEVATGIQWVFGYVTPRGIYEEFFGRKHALRIIQVFPFILMSGRHSWGERGSFP